MKTRKKASSAKKAAKGTLAKRKKDFPAVFEALKEILSPYEKNLRVIRYRPEFYYLETEIPCHTGKPVHFGATRLGKAYVSYYLMPVYMNPSLLKGMSPELKKRMQGKACFNFTSIEPVLFRELAELTRNGFEEYRKRKLV
jgi:hypothetical protein